MDWIRLILDPPFFVSHNASQDSCLLDIWSRRPNPDRFADVVRFEQLIAPCQVLVVCHKDEIISMHQAIDIAGRMVEVARRRVAFGEFCVDEDLGVMDGPSLCGIQSAVHRVLQLAANLRVGSMRVFGWQLDVDVTNCIRIPMGAADIKM